MSNMLYACSILYKTKLPMILVFNKTDVKDAGFAKEWMTDFEAFQAALKAEEEEGSFGGVEGIEGGSAGGSGYMGSLLNSMSLMLEEFYKQLNVVGVSSMTGQGVDEFFKAIDEKVKEFNRDYKPELERRRKEREKQKGERKEKELGRLLKDLNVSGRTALNSPASRHTGQRKDGPETLSDVESDAEGDIPAEMVEPDDEYMNDEDDEDDEERDHDGGLTRKYKQALAGDDGTSSSRTEEDQSFARYMRASNMKKEGHD